VAIMKRIEALVGSIRTDRIHVGSLDQGWVCPHCHRQAELALEAGQLVCSHCGRSPQP